jgi:ABC-type glycerol-3-phosphate transport system permease component
MSVQAASLPVAARTKQSRLRVRPSRIVLNVGLALIALFWLVPSIGIAIISLRPNSAFEQSGWWTVFTAPAQLTFSNYQGLLSAGFKAGGVLDSLTTSIAITVPVTILVTLISSLTAYSLVFGRWRGRTLVFLLIVAMLVLPLQMALIPVSSLYKVVDNGTGLHLFGSVIGTIIFHVAFGLPFGIFLMRNFYSGIPHDLLEAGRIDGAGEWTLFRKVACHLPVHLGLERPARRARLPGEQHTHHADDVPVRTDPSAGQQLLHHLDGGDDLDHHSPDRVLRLPAVLRPRRARRGGQMRSVAWPA